MTEPARDTPYSHGLRGLFQSLTAAEMESYPSVSDALRCPPIDPTPIRYNDPEVLARAEALRVARRRRLAELTARHAAVVARCSGTLRAVVEAHGPSLAEDGWSGDTATCGGCSYDAEAWEGGPGEWPCWTFETIEENPA